MGGPRRRSTLARNLGLFVGNIVRGVRTDPAGARSTEVRREVEEEQVETSRGTVTLRRTIIEEVDLPAETDRDRA